MTRGSRRLSPTLDADIQPTTPLDPRDRVRWLWVCTLLLGFSLSGCAGRRLELPSGPGLPFDHYQTAFDQIAGRCREIQTLTAELALAGRSGATRIRARALVGLTSDGIRLEGLAPFGPPAFILVGRAAEATLWLPRDRRFVASTSAADILEALAGIALSPGQLLAIATGCVTPDPRPRAGRAYDRAWVAIDLEDGATVFARPSGTAHELVAATVQGFVVEYVEFAYGLPSDIRLRSSRSGETWGVETDLTVGISQFETNRTLGPEVFSLVIPDDAMPMSLDELRAAGPLGAAR